MEKLILPLTEEKIANKKAGEQYLVYGTLYTARDEAHKRFIEAIDNDKGLPFDLKDQVIYYAGPTPPSPDKIIGAVGPTTSCRMDKYTPRLLERGLKGMIGKGYRSQLAIKSMQDHKAIYFATIGGAGAFISKFIKKAELFAYEDLGPEAIYKLEIEGLPVVVINDIYGGDFYHRQG
ncbi:MAG: FumA C-terminus/TtdB family hydratase beta subunit [bacterium]